MMDDNRGLLEKLRLYEGSYLKRAAALLFHPDPEQYVTGAFVKVGFFREGMDLVYQDEVHGNLFQQIVKLMDLLNVIYKKDDTMCLTRYVCQTFAKLKKYFD